MRSVHDRGSGRTGPLATVLCVQDNDLAGIMSLSVAEERRREGLGTRNRDLGAALGAHAQRPHGLAAGEGDNAPAIALYERLGFRDAYRYCYWRQEQAK